MVKITRHSDELNGRATFILNGIHAGDARALIALFRSDVPIDRATRDAIADALERKSGVRLELKRGNEAPLTSHFETELNYQEMRDSFDARMKQPGAVEKNVKKDVAAEFKVSARTVATALGRPRHVRLTRG